MFESPLRNLPKMDVLLAHPFLDRAREAMPRSALRAAARAVLEEVRAQGGASPTAVPGVDELARRVERRLGALGQPHLRRVINATGIPLHTNLGRAPLAEAAAQAAYEAARGYSNLEYSLDTGKRGARHSHIEELLCKLTGAEAALAVNNNAAAVFLMLTALAAGKNVAVSRGELVEIGGGFRVPDIMARSGCHLVEVGTTNKTRLSDYGNSNAQCLLKVHTSNYALVGFTEETTLGEMASLGLPLLYDLGSGALNAESFPSLPGPTVAKALEDGADVVCFSGDKLLGGPQAGLIVGKRAYIETMRRDPMARAFRMGKLGLAALEATLLLYAESPQSIPLLHMLNAPPQVLRARAEELAHRCGGEAVSVTGQVGGGSMPNVDLPSWAVAVKATPEYLRSLPTPVVARMHGGKTLLDVRTLTGEDMDALVEMLGHG